VNSPDIPARRAPLAIDHEADIVRAFGELPALLDADAALVARGHRLSVECRLGPHDHPFHVSFVAGRIVDITPAPVLMRSWCFSFCASPTAWVEFWRPVPRPGWHDLFALTKSGEAILEGDLFPFMSHLQFFKDVLALPRGRARTAT
jgi:hypothetical protein